MEPAVADLLSELGDRVAPIALAKERRLPLIEPLTPLFPERGLVRGRVLACRGGAARSMALAVASRAVIEGSWLALVDVASFGPDAADELGVPLERVVRVSTTIGSGESVGDDRRAAEWIDAMVAAADGFDLVLTEIPDAVRIGRFAASTRKMISRLQRRGTVVVALGDTGAISCDGVLDTGRSTWVGLGQGAGRLRCRTIEIVATGRRMPGERRCSIEIVSDHVARGGVSIRPVIEPESIAHPAFDPSEIVVAEMVAADVDVVGASVDDVDFDQAG